MIIQYHYHNNLLQIFSCCRASNPQADLNTWLCYFLRGMWPIASATTSTLQIFYEEENVFNIYFRPQEWTKCISVSNNGCKHKFCFLITKKQPQGTFNICSGTTDENKLYLWRMFKCKIISTTAVSIFAKHEKLEISETAYITYIHAYIT